MTESESIHHLFFQCSAAKFVCAQTSPGFSPTILTVLVNLLVVVAVIFSLLGLQLYAWLYGRFVVKLVSIKSLRDPLLNSYVLMLVAFYRRLWHNMLMGLGKMKMHLSIW